MTRSLPHRFPPGGFSLVEVALAVGIVAFCLLALIGVTGVGMVNNRESLMEMRAAHAVEAILAARRAAPFSTSGAFAADSMPLGSLAVPTVGTVSNPISAAGTVVSTNPDFLFIHRVEPDPVGRSSLVQASAGWPPEAPSQFFEISTRILWP